MFTEPDLAKIAPGSRLPAGPHTMPECSFCGAHLVRRHRAVYQKLVCTEAYRCKQCGLTAYRWRPALRIDRWILFSRWARCPSCGGGDVYRSARRDRAGSNSTHLLSRFQRMLLAPMNACASCRLQFYDWRPIKRSGVESVIEGPSAAPESRG